MPSPASINQIFNYIIPPESGLRVCLTPRTIFGGKTYESRQVTLENIRGKEATYTLNRSGFQFFKHSSKHTAFQNDDDIVKEYYPESNELIRKLAGASRVEIFDHTIREIHRGSDRHPHLVPQVQIDPTPATAIAHVHKHLPAEDASELLEKRFQIISLWRPIGHPVIAWPLGICDYRSVDPENDLVPMTFVYPDREEERIGMQYNPTHSWKYLHGMATDEVVLIKCFDSIQDSGVARFVPHIPFYGPNDRTTAQSYQFIVLHALVVYH